MRLLHDGATMFQIDKTLPGFRSSGTVSTLWTDLTTPGERPFHLSGYAKCATPSPAVMEDFLDHLCGAKGLPLKIYKKRYDPEPKPITGKVTIASDCMQMTIVDGAAFVFNSSYIFARRSLVLAFAGTSAAADKNSVAVGYPGSSLNCFDCHALIMAGAKAKAWSGSHVVACAGSGVTCLAGGEVWARRGSRVQAWGGVVYAWDGAELDRSGGPAEVIRVKGKAPKIPDLHFWN